MILHCNKIYFVQNLYVVPKAANEFEFPKTKMTVGCSLTGFSVSLDISEFPTSSPEDFYIDGFKDCQSIQSQKNNDETVSILVPFWENCGVSKDVCHIFPNKWIRSVYY